MAITCLGSPAIGGWSDTSDLQRQHSSGWRRKNKFDDDQETSAWNSPQETRGLSKIWMIVCFQLLSGSLIMFN